MINLFMKSREKNIEPYKLGVSKIHLNDTFYFGNIFLKSKSKEYFLAKNIKIFLILYNYVNINKNILANMFFELQSNLTKWEITETCFLVLWNVKGIFLVREYY